MLENYENILEQNRPPETKYKMKFRFQVRPDADDNPAFDKIADNIKNIQFTS